MNTDKLKQLVRSINDYELTNLNLSEPLFEYAPNIHYKKALISIWQQRRKTLSSEKHIQQSIQHFLTELENHPEMEPLYSWNDDRYWGWCNQEEILIILEK
ncbi:MAG: hypothetical protein MK132_00810 [Lentisphaerales bacterium]|nr:hypothetical protein [Lentisphaerales bacterium]